MSSFFYENKKLISTIKIFDITNINKIIIKINYNYNRHIYKNIVIKIIYFLLIIIVTQ